eukprot:scaffold112084_cov63-Attheya_sp.AAC.2
MIDVWWLRHILLEPPSTTQCKPLRVLLHSVKMIMPMIYFADWHVLCERGCQCLADENNWHEHFQ